MEEKLVTNQPGTMNESDLSYLDEFIRQCPNPRISEALRRLVDGWKANKTSVPQFSAQLQKTLQSTADEILEISWLLAINPKTPPSVLDDLCVGASDGLLERIAENKNTGALTLSRLSYQAVAEIRIAAAGNPTIPMASIMLLVEDDNPDVRFSIAENPKVPEQALQALTNDDNPYIKMRAEVTLLRAEVERNVFRKKH